MAAPAEAAATPEAAVDALSARYDAAVAALRGALERYAETGKPPDPKARADGLFCYPELRVIYQPDGPAPLISRAFGKFAQPGVYAASITRPEFFRAYLLEQLHLLDEIYDVDFEVGTSSDEIPFPYVLESAGKETLGALSDPTALARHFPSTELTDIGDELADGLWAQGPDAPLPLALFDAPRADYSLQRLQHYTGTEVADFQQYILFTNYHRYVDAFIAWGLGQLGEGEYDGFVAPGVSVETNEKDAGARIDAGPWRRSQMPAYHLKAPGRRGITLVNIGVGPSNAKTITDHLAVLRPQCWMMIGHCGGLRHSQRLGDYVLAHAYLRCDNVLDDVIPIEVPVPAIAEIQVALQDAAAEVTGQSGETLKTRLRTGTVVTNADRNWELRASTEARRFNQSRAIAIDMESATIATNGFRFRVPYGALLCVSDKPLHGELKLPGPAGRFYEEAVSQHLQIGIAALERLKRDGDAALHSRKLRAFDEPPFR
ncbi:MAG: AMP nucleosidase [Maricaulaceae bacterium]|jgi:AMP nucleosidase